MADFFAGRTERDFVELTERVDLIPMGANVAILQGDVVRAAWLPSTAAAALMEAFSLHKELWNTSDGLGDAPGFIGCEVIVTERPLLEIIAAMHGNEPKAIGVKDLEAVGPDLLNVPRWWETAVWRLDSVLAEIGHSRNQNRPLLIAVGGPAFIEAGRWNDAAPTPGDVPADRFDIAIGLLVTGRGGHTLLAVRVKDEAMFWGGFSALRGSFDNMLMQDYGAVCHALFQPRLGVIGLWFNDAFSYETAPCKLAPRCRETRMCALGRTLTVTPSIVRRRGGRRKAATSELIRRAISAGTRTSSQHLMMKEAVNWRRTRRIQTHR